MMRSNKRMSVDAPRERKIPHTWKPTKRNAFVGMNCVCVRLNALVSWLLASSPFFPVLTAATRLMRFCTFLHMGTYSDSSLLHIRINSFQIKISLCRAFIIRFAHNGHEYFLIQIRIHSVSTFDCIEWKEGNRKWNCVSRASAVICSENFVIKLNETLHTYWDQVHFIQSKTYNKNSLLFFHCNNKQKRELPHRKMMLFELLRSSIWFVRLHNFRIIPNSLDSSFFFHALKLNPLQSHYIRSSFICFGVWKSNCRYMFTFRHNAFQLRFYRIKNVNICFFLCVCSVFVIALAFPHHLYLL